MHAEQALSDLRLTTRQRAQDFRYLALALERRLVSKPRTPHHGSGQSLDL
jgi:hypothetical protein